MHAKWVSRELFKETFAHVASSVSIVTTVYRNAPIGVTISSLVSLSLEPPLALICLGKHMFMPVAIREHGAFAVNILSAEQCDWAMRFAGMLPDTDDRFADIQVRTAVNGSPILPNCLAWLECELWNTYDGGDHVIIVGEVQDMRVISDRQPLLYYNRQWRRSMLLNAVT